MEWVTPSSTIAKDFITGMGRTNDAIIYGGVVQLIIDGPEDDLKIFQKLCQVHHHLIMENLLKKFLKNIIMIFIKLMDLFLAQL